MRIKLAGIARAGDAFSFSYDGQVVEAYPGESLAAALISAGHLGYRETRSGERRGVFCGMGVCGECSVVVNGRSRRACMEMAAPGLVVEHQPVLRSVSGLESGLETRSEMSEEEALPIALPSTDRDRNDPCNDNHSEKPYEHRDVEVLVIGAGPAGIAAARAAAESGAQVLLVDERVKAGGQYFKQPGQGFVVDETRLDSQFEEGLGLYRQALASGVEFRFGATVWGAFPGPVPKVAVVTTQGQVLISAPRVIVSPGAYERPMPFPGWTLPGVMTTGAAQTLLRAYQTAPGKRVLVAGNGPLNLQVARELDAAGVNVVAVVELSRAPSPGKVADIARMCLSSPRLVFDGVRHVLALARSRVPMLYQHVVVAASGEQHVNRVSIARVDSQGSPVAGSETHFSVDAVCLGYGFLAQSEIARALGVGPQEGLGEVSSVAPAPDNTGEAVVIAGDAGGLGGARVAISQGTLAGLKAAQDLGYATAGFEPAITQARKRLARHRRFQKALWSVYDAPVITLGLASRPTIVCRCESVTLGELEDVLAGGVASIGAIKRETRAGMGRCQGRYCAGLLGQLLQSAGEAPTSAGPSSRTARCALEEDLFFAPRPPFKPLAIAELASAYDPQQVFDRSAGIERSPASDMVVEAELP